MKKTLLIIAFVIINPYLKAQTCSEEGNGKGFSIWFESTELDSIDGNMDIKVVLYALDTIKLGSQLVLSSSGFAIDTVSITNTKDSLVVGDSIIFILNISYNKDLLPFYPVDINLTLADIHCSECSHRKFNKKIKVYFTPWNTVELWNLYDFHQSKRVWIYDNGTPQPRVFIHKDSIPVSDITGDSLLSDSGIFYFRKVNGLAYAIPFNEPDTFGHDSILPPNESLPNLRRADGCGLGRKEFTGRIENLRIYTWYNPSGSNPTKVWLKNAKIELRVNRWPDPIVKKCKTDNEGYVTFNGNRSFNFEFCAGGGHTFKEVTFLIGMCDPDNPNKLRVKNAGSWRDYYVHVTPDIDLEHSNNNPVISDRIGTEFGDWWEYGIPVEHYGLLYTQLGWAKEYSNNELLENSMKVTQNLAVKIEEDLKLHDQSDAAHYNPFNRTIHLGTERYTNEGTVFHEYGHHFFRHIYGWWNYTGKSTHFGSWNNVHPKQTISEGMANAFAGIMDEMTWSIMGEVSNQRDYHPSPFFRETTKSTGEFLSRLTTPVLSERYLASVVLDLWDGTANYNKSIVS